MKPETPDIGVATAKPAEKPDASASTPRRLTKQQVKKAMRKINPLVQACYERYHIKGIYKVKLVVTPNGRVKSARIHRSVADTNTGRCVQAAAMVAIFPRFEAKALTFVYPFVLH